MGTPKLMGIGSGFTGIASQTSASPAAKPPDCSSQPSAFSPQPSAVLAVTNFGVVASHISLLRIRQTL